MILVDKTFLPSPTSITPLVCEESIDECVLLLHVGRGYRQLPQAIVRFDVHRVDDNRAPVAEDFGASHAYFMEDLGLRASYLAVRAPFPSTTSFGGGAMGYAAHFDRREIAAFLAPLSRDVHELTYLGMMERLRALFAEDPQLANAVAPRAGITPLFRLPDDEDEALAMAILLLEHGADPDIVNRDGLTAEQKARRRGLIDAADLMCGGETA